METLKSKQWRFRTLVYLFMFVSRSSILSRVVRVYKGSGDRPGTPIRGQVIDRSHEYAAGDRLKSR